MLGSLSVVLPAFNEQENVPVVVARCLEVLPRVAAEWEVIVVDDGSTDDTFDVARVLVEEHHPHLRLIRHTRNEGYGAAIRTGFRAARHDFIFYTDADNQFDVGELEYFTAPVANHDVVIGFRVYRYDTVVRSILSWIYNRLIRILFRVRVRDVDCAYKLFRREVIDKISIDTDDFFVDAELVAKARKWNFSIAEKGVRHYPRMAGETTVRASDIPRTLRVIARMWQRIYLPTRAQKQAAHTHRESIETVEFLPAGSASATRRARC